MLLNVFLTALVASPLVAAHCKIAVATGDQGGNTTALGIQGGVVPGPGKNSVTEVDTTVFGSTKLATNGLGKTTGGGQNKLSGMSAVMAQSGNVLPQVSGSGNGSLTAVVHVVTSDGFGQMGAICDPTGTGQFASGTQLNVMTNIPGTKGNLKAGGGGGGGAGGKIRRFLMDMGIIEKRATNVNKDFTMKVAIPAGMTCTGTVGGQSNVCLIKLANPSNAGPFGGVVAVQVAGTGGTAGGATVPAGGAGNANTATTKGGNNNKNKMVAEEFNA